MLYELITGSVIEQSIDPIDSHYIIKLTYLNKTDQRSLSKNNIVLPYLARILERIKFLEDIGLEYLMDKYEQLIKQTVVPEFETTIFQFLLLYNSVYHNVDMDINSDMKNIDRNMILKVSEFTADRNITFREFLLSIDELKGIINDKPESYKEYNLVFIRNNVIREVLVEEVEVKEKEEEEKEKEEEKK